MALDFLGISPAGPERDPGAASRPRKRPPTRPACSRCSWCATTCGRRTSSRARRSTTRPRRSPPAAGRRTACCTCSRSRASSASRTRSRTSTRSRRGRRSIASIKPGGRFVATDVHAAGGVALVARELLKGDDLLTGSSPNVDGRTLGEIADDARGDGGPGGRRRARDAAEGDRRPARDLRQPGAGRLRREARRPRAARPPRARARLRLARRTASRRSRRATIHPGDVVVIRYEGPAGGPGMREMLHVTAAIVGEGLSRLGRARHRRALLGRDARVHGRPRHARGVARRPARGARGGRHGRARRRVARAARRALRRRARRPGSTPGRRPSRATRPASSPSTRALVSSASEGAVTRP